VNFLNGLTKKAEDLASRLYDQANPTDNGLSYQTRRVNPAVPPRSVVQQVSHMPVINPVLRADQGILNYGNNMAAGLAHGGQDILRTTISNPIREMSAQLTHNPLALRNAQLAQNQSIQGAQNLIAPVLRTVPEVANTITHPFSQFSYHPNSPLEQALFGQQPVQNIQQKVINNYQTHPNLPLPARLGLAGAEGVASVAQDAPVLGAFGKAAKAAKVPEVAGAGINQFRNANEIGAVGKDVGGLKDRFGHAFSDQQVPINTLKRQPEYQPRTTASGAGTQASVYKQGYNESFADQPILVWKKGDKNIVLGGHSRTAGLEQRAAEGLPNPEKINARVYEGLKPEQARQISRSANQGAQYENTLDMAKSIAESHSEKSTSAVQKQNMIKGFRNRDYGYLWHTVKTDKHLQDKITAGAIPHDEVLAAARRGRMKNLTPEQTSAVIRGLDRNGTFSRQNALNVINLLAGKKMAKATRENQAGLFGEIERAVNATDLLKEYKKTSAELVKKRNALNIASKEVGKNSAAYGELNAKFSEYESKLKNLGGQINDAVSKPKPAPKLADFKKEAPKAPPKAPAVKKLPADMQDRPPHIQEGYRLSAKMTEPEVKTELTKRLLSHGKNADDVSRGQGGGTFGNFEGNYTVGGYVKGKKITNKEVAVELADGRVFKYKIADFYKGKKAETVTAPKTSETGAVTSQPPTASKVAPKPVATTKKPATDPESKIINPIDTKLAPKEKVKQLQKLTDENIPFLDKLIKDMDAKHGTESKYNIKDPENVLKKAERPSILEKKPWHGVEHIRDSLRFKSVLSHPDQLVKVAEEFKKAGITIVKKDFDMMTSPKGGENGYGWRAAVLDLRMPNGQLVEHYMPFKSVEKVKDATNHHIFEKWRNLTKKEIEPRKMEMFQDLARSYKNYQEAYERDLAAAGVDEAQVRAAASKADSLLESITGSHFAKSSSKVGTGIAEKLPSAERTTLASGKIAKELPSSAVKVKNGLSVSDINDVPSTNTLSQFSKNGKRNPNAEDNNRFTLGGKEGRQNIGPETQKAISGRHDIRSTKQLAEEAETEASKLKLDDLIAKAHDRMAVKLGNIDDKDVAFTQQAIERADKEGRFDDASALHDTLSEHLVKNGQTVQAASLFYRRSPQGMVHKAERDLKKAGVTLTDDIRQNLRDRAESIKNSENPARKQRTTAEFQKYVRDNIPRGKLDNALSVWKAGLLSGVKTHEGNVLSNTAFGALKTASNPLSAAFDKTFSLGTRQRTKTLTSKGNLSGFKEGSKKGLDTLKTGIDERAVLNDKYENTAS
jgi:hypothetical protein